MRLQRASWHVPLANAHTILIPCIFLSPAALRLPCQSTRFAMHSSTPIHPHVHAHATQHAKKVGAVDLPRPWSKYSEGSSRNDKERRQQQEQQGQKGQPQGEVGGNPGAKRGAGEAKQRDAAPPAKRGRKGAGAFRSSATPGTRAVPTGGLLLLRRPIARKQHSWNSIRLLPLRGGRRPTTWAHAHARGMQQL